MDKPLLDTETPTPKKGRKKAAAPAAEAPKKRGRPATLTAEEKKAKRAEYAKKYREAKKVAKTAAPAKAPRPRKMVSKKWTFDFEVIVSRDDVVVRRVRTDDVELDELALQRF